MLPLRIAAGRHALARSRAPPSRQELILYLVVGYELACLRLAKTLFDLRKEAQSSDGVLERGLFGQGQNRLDGSLRVDTFQVDESTIVKFTFRRNLPALTSRASSPSLRPLRGDERELDRLTRTGDLGGASLR